MSLIPARLLDYRTLSAEYAAYHRTEGNKRTHLVGIPLIAFAIVRWSQLGSPLPLAALALPVYFAWDKRLGREMTAFIVVSAVIGHFVTVWTAWTCFIVGWAFQFYGHTVYEKNSPALVDNLIHALVGPAFVADKLAGRA